ncbi:MAG: hypothetical protein ACI89X_003326 [Planctomycetota bacterium]|jgi:hypothetical protein
MNAMRSQDFDGQVALAHPGLIDGVGGEAAYRETIERVAGQMPDALKPSLTDDAEVLVAGGRAFGRVHFAMEITLPDGKSGTVLSSMIAECAVDGSSWGFIDGSGIKADRAKLERVIKGFPAELDLPVTQDPVWK